MTGFRARAGASLLGCVLLASCASVPVTTGEAAFSHPAEGVIVVDARGPVLLTVCNEGPGAVEIHEVYEEDDLVRSRRFGPGTRLIRRFRGHGRVRFTSLDGPRGVVRYRVEGDAEVTVSGRAGEPEGDAPVELQSWSQSQVERR